MNLTILLQVSDACARFILPPTNKNLTQLKILRKNIKYISFNNLNETKFESKNHWSQFKTSSQAVPIIPVNSSQSSTALNDLDAKNSSEEMMNSKTPRTPKPSTKSARLSTVAETATPKAAKSTNVRFTFTPHSTNNAANLLKSNESHMQDNWIECWQTKNAEVSIQFEFYLCPVLDWSNDKLPSVQYYKSLNSPKFDCEILQPDTIRLKIEIGPSVVMMYGTFLKRLWYIKEGFFSWDQYYTEMIKNLEQALQQPVGEQSKTKSKISRPYMDIPVQMVACNYWDPRNFRSLSVTLSLAIHNINGYLVLDVSEGVGDVPLPIAFTDRLALELDKNYKETKLQLYVDPVSFS
jgi:hypothetical protein